MYSPSLARGSFPDHSGLGSGSGNITGLSLKEHEQNNAPSLVNRTTCRPVSRTTHTKPRAGSLSTASEDSIPTPITPPPIINHLLRLSERENAQPKPHQMGIPTTQECHYAESQLYLRPSMTVPDEEEAASLLKWRLQCLSAPAIAQAVLMKEAEVEWKRLRTLATAWEIHSLEQYQRFLHMILEDDCATYTTAASQPLATSVEAISNCSLEELRERMDFCRAAYESEASSFMTGDSQLDLIEDIACARLEDVQEDHWSVSMRKTTLDAPHAGE